MSLRDILNVYAMRLRARAVLVQEGFAIVGLAVGVALLFASQVASTSLAGSVSQLTGQLVGHTDQMQLDARGPIGFSERIAQEVQRLPGVSSSMGMVEAPVTLRGPHGQLSVQLFGADPRYVNVGGPLLSRFGGAALASMQAIALPAAVAGAVGVGSLDQVRLQVGALLTKTVVGAVLQESEIGALAGSPVAMVPISYAQTLIGMRGRLSRVFVRPQAGRAGMVHRELTRVAAANDVNLAPGNADARLFSVAASPEAEGETLFSAISALVGFMLALNAMLITVPARRKLIDALRLAGATRWMVVQVLLFDALMLGGLGAIVGLGLGDLLSIVVFRSTPGYLSSAFPVGDSRIVSWQSVAIAGFASVLAAVIGVLWPLRDRLMLPPGAAASDALELSRRWSLTRLGVGGCCLAAATVVLFAAPQAAVAGAVALVLALVCLLPAMFDLCVRTISGAQRVSYSAPLKLAVAELRTPTTRVRSLAIAATGAVAVFGTVSIGGAQSNLQRGLDASARAIDSSADVWVAPSGQSSVLATMPFKAIDRRRLETISGVRAVGVYRGGFLDWGDRRLWVLAQPSQSLAVVPADQLLKGNLRLAEGRIRQGGWAVLSQALAAEHHLRIGESFTLPAPRPITLRVASLATNLGWPPGAIVMSSADYARAWRSGEPSAYEIQIAPGASPAAVSARVQQAIGPSTGLRVETLARRVSRHYALAAQGLSRLAQIRLLVLLAAILATAGAMGAMLWQRRDLVAWVRCQGYAPGPLWRWLALECAIMLGAGCLIGALAGIYGELMNSHALAIATGFPVYFHVATRLAVMNFVAVAVAALAIVCVAGYLVVRVPPRTASPAY